MAAKRSIDWLKHVVHFIDDERKAGRTVFVHCFAGMNRSGMIVTAISCTNTERWRSHKRNGDRFNRMWC
jgi:protein-tyrosine phosphatase